MPDVFALDLGTQIGWASGDLRTPRMGPGVTPPKRWHGAESLAKYNMDDGSLGLTFSRYRSWLMDMLKVHQPTYVIFEAPFVRQPNAAEKLFGLAAYTEGTAYEYGVADCISVKPNVWKKDVLGTGYGTCAPKVYLQFVRDCGYSVESADVAAAMGVLDFIIAHPSNLKGQS